MAFGRGKRTWPAWLEWLAPGQRGDLSDIEFEFVKMEQMGGYQRWRLWWRTDPATPWPAVIDVKFRAGSSQDIYEEAVALNEQLAKEFAEAERRERQRQRDKEKAAREKRDEEHRVGAEDGTHTSGAWFNCPTCNPGKHRNRPRKGD